MLSFKRASIGKKLTGMSVLASCTALTLASAAYLAYDVINFRNSMVRALSTQADIIGYNSISALLFRDERSAGETLAALKAETQVTLAAVYSKEGRLFAYYVRGDSSGAFQGPQVLSPVRDTFRFEREHLIVIRPITFRAEQIGAVYIQSDLDELYARLKRLVGIGIAVFSMSTLVSLLISSMLQRNFSQPISRLAEAAKIVSRQKDYSHRVTVASRQDEMGQLVETFNEMLEQIQERDVALQKGREEVEQRVNERTAELAATNKELEAFTYSVSHDLRGPLRHVDGFSKLLLEELGRAEISTDARRYLSRIQEGTTLMGHLVDDLLNLARVGRKELSLQVTGLNSLVDSVVRSLKQENPDRAIEWSIQSLPFVECDPGLMNQVFVNLLSNAVKYTRPRERAFIEVGTRNQNGHVEIFVRDNGVGFSMKYAEKLFGVFQRLHRSEDFEGTGVGLATVQRIIHKHGGRVWAEAALDRGATFYFTLRDQDEKGPEQHTQCEEATHGRK